MDKYYEGMFESLKHNIFLMLNQMDGNEEYTNISIIPHLEKIESRIKDIKEKLIDSPQTNQSVQQGRGDALANGSTIADGSSEVKTEDTKGCRKMYCGIEGCKSTDESKTAIVF